MTAARSTTQFETDTVRVTRWDIARGEATGAHVHEFDYVVVPVSAGTMRVRLPDGSEVVNALDVGTSYHRPAGTEHDVRNDDDEPVSFVEIELLHRPLRQ